MFKKNTVILAILAGVLLLVALFAFFYVTGKIGTGENRSWNDSTVKPLQLKETKLTFYIAGPKPTQYAEDFEAVLEEIEKRTKNDLNIQLDFQWVIYNRYYETIKNKISNGEPCDMFCCYSDNSIARTSLKELAQKGLLADITKLFPQYAPNYYSNFTDKELYPVTFDGKLVAIPNRMPTTTRRCAIVKEDLMEKYNIPAIENYDDLETFMRIIKQKEPNISPLSVSCSTIELFAEAYGYAVLDYQMGLVYKWDDPNMKIMAWEQTPEYINAINTIYRWSQKGYLLNGAESGDKESQMLRSGKLASCIDLMGREERYNTIAKHDGNNWRYKEYDLYPGEISQRLADLLNGCIAFNAHSANIERALKFVEWVESSQENYDLLMYGINGKNYELYGDQFARLDFSWYGQEVFKNIDYERTSTSSSPDYKKSYIKAIEAYSKYPPHLGFYPDYNSVKNIANPRLQEVSEIESNIQRASYSLDTINKYIRDQKKSGIDKLVSVIQKQIDDWIASKKN